MQNPKNSKPQTLKTQTSQFESFADLGHLMADAEKILEKWPKDRLRQLFLDNFDANAVRLSLNTLLNEQTKQGIYATISDREETIQRTEETISSIFLADVPKMSKANYRIAKTLAVELNRINNGGYLIVTQDVKRHWCVLGDLSAILYVYDANIGGSYRTRPKLTIDGDLENKFSDGVSFVHGFRSLVEKLFAAGIVYWANLKNGVWIFRLDRIRTPEEIESLRQRDRKLTDAVRNLIISNNIYPDFFGIINKLTRMTLFHIKKMDIIARDIFGIELAKTAVSLHNSYIAMVNSKPENRLAYLEKINQALVDIGGWLDLMLENNFIDKETLGKMANLLSDAKVRSISIRKELKKNAQK